MGVGAGQEASEISVGVAGQSGEVGILETTLEDCEGLELAIVEGARHLVPSMYGRNLILGVALQPGQVPSPEPCDRV